MTPGDGHARVDLGIGAGELRLHGLLVNTTQGRDLPFTLHPARHSLRVLSLVPRQTAESGESYRKGKNPVITQKGEIPVASDKGLWVS